MLTNTTGMRVWGAHYTAFGSTIIDADPDASGQQIAFQATTTVVTTTATMISATIRFNSSSRITAR